MGPIMAQGLAALIANLTMFSAGMIFAWSTPSLPKLLNPENENDLKLTTDEISWVVSLMSLGCIFGPFLLNFVVDRIGRKWSLNLIMLPMLVCWLILGLATNAETLYAGRFIGGLGIGGVFGLLPMYLGEIAEDRIRGAIGVLMTCSVNFGTLLSFCTGPYISRSMLSVVSAVPPALFLILFLWVPESPYFLLMKGEREKARASLVWLRRRTDVEEELAALEINVAEQQKNHNGFNIVELFGTLGNRKAFGISLGLLTIQGWSGILAIQSYAGIIFDESGLSGWTNGSVIIMGVVKAIIGIASAFIIDIAGRRPILLSSAFFSALFLGIEGVFFHMKYLGYDTSSYSWTPVLGIIAFDIVNIPGLASIPNMMISELFPTNVKAPATMLLASYGSLMGFSVSKLYQVIVGALGTHWIFYIFTTATLGAVFFVYFCVPETKKLSLQDIQDNLNSGSTSSKIALASNHSNDPGGKSR